jgi:hypothetical protein
MQVRVYGVCFGPIEYVPSEGISSKGRQRKPKNLPDDF